MDDLVLTLEGDHDFNQDFSLQLLNARKINIDTTTYLKARNELETLEHDGKLIAPNILNFLEQKFCN